MNNVIAIVNDLVKGLTSIFMGLLGLGVLAGILFGDLMGIDVVGGLLNIVNTLGEQGLVGLLVAETALARQRLAVSWRWGIPKRRNCRRKRSNSDG